MRYWLFQIIDRWYPDLWPYSLKNDLAIHNYTDEWGDTDCKKALFYLKKMSKGDMVVAGFLGHLFAGYGFLKSHYYHGKTSLDITGNDGEGRTFFDRYDCEWTALPYDKDPNYRDLSVLKRMGRDIDFRFGLPVHEIDEKTFFVIKKVLDQYGAITKGGL